MRYTSEQLKGRGALGIGSARGQGAQSTYRLPFKSKSQLVAVGMMDIPDSVKTVVLWLTPEFHDSQARAEEVFAICMDHLDLDGKRAFVKFVNALEAANMAADELQRLWWRTGARFYMSDANDIIALFRKVREVAMSDIRKSE